LITPDFQDNYKQKAQSNFTWLHFLIKHTTLCSLATF